MARIRAKEGQQVDPRVRGGAGKTSCHGDGEKGRSPRARGSHDSRSFRRCFRGSIPACAGEPSEVSYSASFAKVDPRVRGGATAVPVGNLRAKGRFPRARGSPGAQGGGGDPKGSIPACAGEPPMASPLHRHFESIPACAGEPEVKAALAISQRSIPACAGEPAQPNPYALLTESIPACAGEPL